MSPETRNAFIAAGLIIAALFVIMLAMPTIMTFVTGFGPAGGLGMALIVMLAFVALFWMRGRYQRRDRGLDDREQ